MQADTIQRYARARAEELPGAGLEHPFGPEWEVFKVGGKVFMLLTEITGSRSSSSKPRRGTARRSASSTRRSRPAIT